MWCFWSAKGGVGCTVVATATALGLAATTPTLIVDLAGDVAALLGRPPCDVGLAGWLDAPAPPPDALSRLEREVAPNLALLSWGPEPDGGSESGAGESISTPGRPTDRAEILARLVDFDARTILVDIGVRAAADGRRSLIAEHLLSLASRSTLVTRACYLAVRAAEPWPPPDDVVLVARQGRALRADDVAAAVGAPVVAELRWDPAVARAVDAGLFGSRVPRSLRRLAGLARP